MLPAMQPPNLLFLFTDEQRYDTLACHGNRRIIMPNLNRLADQSCVFDRAYVSQPVCTPSRSTLLTGLWPHQSGMTENNVSLKASTRCLPEMLRDEYDTAYFGKWHLGDEIFPQHGFADFRGVEDHYRKYYSPGRDQSARCAYHHWLVGHGLAPASGDVFSREEVCRLPEELTKPAFLAEQSCDFIRRRAGGSGRPWMLFVNFLEPHMPFYGPRDGQYDPAEVQLPPNFDCTLTDAQPLKTRLFAHHYFLRGHSGLPLQTEAHWRRMIANYWGLCSLVDTHVGRILAALDDTDQDRQTIVVFTSDHGDMMGSHRLLAKCVMFEEALRVPLLLRLPGQRMQRRIGGAVSQVDLAPTLLDLMGQPPAGELSGRSLRQEIQAGRSDRDVFSTWQGPNSGVSGDQIGRTNLPEHVRQAPGGDQADAAVQDPVRTILTPDGWKLNISATRGEHELYHLPSDPLESHNLCRDEGNRPLMRDLLRRVRRWQQQVNDTVQLPEL
jgi:arylsulfatase A-like enzyme